MALTKEKGTFTKTTSTSTPVSQQVNLSNGSLTPKIIILHTTGHTSFGTYVDDTRISYGFSDGTNSACQALRMDESAESESYTFRDDSIICIIDLASNAIVAQASVSATAAGSFTLSWSVQSDTNALNIHYEVVGGDDITNVSVVSAAIGDTATGNHSFNGSGTTFTPDFALCMTGTENNGVGYNTLTSSTDTAFFCIGAAKSTSQRWVAWSRDETVATSDCDMYISPSACLATCNTGSGAISFLADFVSFNSAAGGGITVNVSDGATNSTCRVAFLLIKGGMWDCGTFQQRSGTGTQDVTVVTDEHLDPELVFLAGINSASSATVVANNYFCIGASDGTNEGYSWFGNQNGVGTFVSSHLDGNDKVYRIATPAATATSSTTNAEADMNDMSIVGKFQLNWTTADSTLRRMAWWAVGVAGAANFARSPSTDSVTISESIGRQRTAAAGTPQNFKVGVITKDTTTGAHTQNFTNEAGFTPQWGIFILTNKTASGSGAHIQNSVGVTDGTNHYCVLRRTIDGNNSAGSSVNGFMGTDNYTMGIFPATSGSSTTIEGTVVFGSNGWDISWGKADANAYKIIYIVGGGGGFDDAKVTAHTLGSNPNQYTNVGFQGDIVFLLHAPAGTVDTLTSTLNLDIGCGMSTTSRWSLSHSTNSGFATDASRSQRTNLIINGISNATADRGKADFDGFLSNGFDFANPSGGNTTDTFGSLVIKGGLWDIGAFDQATSNGTQQVNITTGRTPVGVMLFTFGAAATTSHVANARMSIGATDGTTEASIWDGFLDADATSYKARSDFSDTKVIRTLAEGSGTQTLETEADYSSFQSGSFTINNTTTDATSRQILYIAFTPETTGTNYERSPSADSVTVSDASTTRILTANRAPSSDSTTVSDASLTRILSAARSPSSDSVTAEDGSLTRSQTWTRQPSDETVVISDVSTTQMITRVRAPDAETVTLGENTSRMTQAFRSPSSDSVTVGESLSGGKLLERAPSAENVTVADSSLTRLLSASRSPSADDITIGENLTRILSAMRSPSSDSVVISDVSTTQMITRVRSVEDTVSVTDASLTRILSATRSPSSDSVTVTDSSLTRIYSALRLPSTDTVVIDESVDRVVTNPGQFNRSPATENVSISENLSRTLQAFRAPSSDTVTVGESLSGGKLLERVVAADTVNIVEASLNRVLSVSRNVEDTSNVNEASLTRLLTALRAPSPDSVTVSELQNQISHSRVLQDTVTITEPLLQRIVTHIRSLGPEFVEVSEQVFFQTWHRYVFDSVIVADQVFAQRQSLSGPTTYAIPSEVRPLLGNIGSQRTDTQIQLAIDSAYDEINKKTMRIPPNDWKDTDADFSIIKKITRMKAALEMSIGIKDFEDREWMQKEIEELFLMLEEHDVGGAQSNDFVLSSEDETYSLNPAGVIWSQRYKNLRKVSSTENDTTINPDA